MLVKTNRFEIDISLGDLYLRLGARDWFWQWG